METPAIQQAFFQHIKTSLPPHLSLVEEIAELLDLSNDSAYRRIRGEKPISFEEIQKLCSHFKVSLDQFLHLESDALIFTGRVNTKSETVFEDYLNIVLKQLSLINSFENKHIYFLMKDMPPYIHFQVPELAAFKFYFWKKSILHEPEMQKVKFSFDDPRYEKYHVISKKVIDMYNKIPMTEIWNIESINSSLRQIDFYKDMGFYESKEDVRILYKKMGELVDHIERQAELGLKFNMGTEPNANSVPYTLFVNELILGDNTFMAELGNVRMTFLNHSVLYFIGTRDEQFNDAMFTNMTNLTKKSTMISTVGEKERVRFFKRLRNKIQQLESSLGR
ncbi:MAG: helix-turn-helix domain-containing protein [Ferruginibacter sp.]